MLNGRVPLDRIQNTLGLKDRLILQYLTRLHKVGLIRLKKGKKFEYTMRKDVTA